MIKILKTWKTILINQENGLPENFSINTEEVFEDKKMDKRCAGKMRKMLEIAKSHGIIIKVVSAYRTYEYQKGLLTDEINHFIKLGSSYRDATDEALKWVAAPGKSEHNSGLAADLIDDKSFELTENFDKTKEFEWLMQNAQKFGFILRYPKDKVHITGINYEPWHFRYVGKYNACRIKKHSLCLEEALNKR